MQTMQNYAFDGMSLMGLIVCAVIFTSVARLRRLPRDPTRQEEMG